MKCIRMLTFLPIEEIEAMKDWEGSQLNKAKEILAYELTKLVIVAAELHCAAVLLVQHIEVVALHYHVVKFKERETALHALLVTQRQGNLLHRL